MTGLPQWLAGSALTLAGWFATRVVAKAWTVRPAAVILDGSVPVIAFVTLSVVTARPIFAGMATFAAFAGLAFADYAKRAVLREPILFCDMSELAELFRHPQLYLPYAGPIRIIAGAVAAVGAIALLLWLEPPVFAWSPVGALIALASFVGAILALATILLSASGRAMTRFSPSGDPVADGARFGELSTLLIYGITARSERRWRRKAVAPPEVASAPSADLPPVILVQSESFFDARRLSDTIATDLLPAFDWACGEGLSGKFATPAWGANTVRTEFEAISGLAGSALGFDRFNPYHAFVRQPVVSLAWTLKRRGYRTICIHPYDRRFYARDKVMGNLGFDLFLGQEEFPVSADGAYVTDAALAEKIIEIMGDDPKGFFVFAITMENHGPWHGPLTGMEDPAPSLPAIAQAGDLKRYAAGLRGADVMIAKLTRALSSGGVLGFYGDHMPSLPKAFDALGFAEESTDYFIWNAGGARPAVADIAAHELPARMLASLDLDPVLGR